MSTAEVLPVPVYVPALASVDPLDAYLKITLPPVPYKRRSVIYNAGPQFVYCVNSGVVRVLRTRNDGERVHVDFYRSGEVFGESCLFTPAKNELAIAHTDCEVSMWRRDQFERLLQNDPAMALSLTRAFSDRAERFLDRMTIALTQKIGFRVNCALLDLADKLGDRKYSNCVKLAPCPTHTEISAMVGTSREIVTSNLNRLRRKGIIRYCRKEMEIWIKELKADAQNSSSSS